MFYSIFNDFLIFFPFLSCRGNMQTTVSIFRLKDLVSPISLRILKIYTLLIVEEIEVDRPDFKTWELLRGA